VEQIKEIVINVIGRLETKKIEAGEKDLNELLKKALTKKELEHIKVNYFKKGILNLSVDSSAWLYNFNLQKQNLITKLNKHMSGIKDIRFYIGETK
jgi:hypothetical protein